MQITKVDAQGGFADGWQVNYLTGSGVTGSVFVPDALYNPDNVRRMITAAVVANDQVQGLTEPATAQTGM